MKKLCLLLAIVLLFACKENPSKNEEKNDSNSKNNPQYCISVDPDCKYSVLVYIVGIYKGSIKPGYTRCFELTVGSHKVKTDDDEGTVNMSYMGQKKEEYIYCD